MAAGNTKKGTEFEMQIAALYRSAGYDITQNYSISGSDFDLLCTKEVSPQIAVCIAVECKFKSGNEKVGPLDVEKFYNKVKYAKDFGITHGVIVCNNGFVPNAHVAAGRGNISLRSSAELEDDLLGFAARFVLAQRKYQTSDIFREYFTLDGFIDQKDPDQTSIQNIEAFVLSSLQQSTRSPRFFLLGDFGAGKTTLIDRLNYTLQQRYLKDRSTRIPIVFRLNRLLVENDLRRFIENQLKSELGLDLSSETFFSLLNNGKITLFLDGLDEIESHADEQAKLHNIARISPLFNSNCDLIIASRPTMFESMSQMLGFFKYVQRNETISSVFDNSELARFNLRSTMERLRTVVAKHAGHTLSSKELADSKLIGIQPLSKQIVISVLQSKAEILEERQSMKIDDIIRELFSIYDMSDLMSRPFLLFMVIDVLKIHKIKEMVDQKTVSSAMLYNIYIESYLKRDWDKGKGRQFLSPLERRTFAQSMALSMLYKSGRLSVTLSEILPVLTRVMNEQMNERRREEIRTKIQNVVSDVLLCAFLRLSGEDMFEFVHKSFMEYFCAEYIATQLVNASNNELIAELNYDLNQEILQFIGGLTTAFLSLSRRIEAQLKFTLFSGRNVYRKNLAAALLYSNQETIELGNANIVDCAFRRKTISRSDFASVKFSNCTFTEVTILNQRVQQLQYNECKFVDSKLKDVQGDFEQTTVACDRTNFSNLRCSWDRVTFLDGKIKNCVINFENNVSVERVSFSNSEIFVKGGDSQNSIVGSKIIRTKISRVDHTTFGSEFKISKESKLNLHDCEFNDVTFGYPTVAPDPSIFENLERSSGVIFTSILELNRRARSESSPSRENAEQQLHGNEVKSSDRIKGIRFSDTLKLDRNVNPAISPFLGVYSEDDNQILIVNLDSDESSSVLRRLINFAGTTDPVVVVRTLINNSGWLPKKA